MANASIRPYKPKKQSIDIAGSMKTGDKGLYLPNCQTNWVFVLHVLSLMLWHCINTTAYHLGRYKSSSPSTKDLHDVALVRDLTLAGCCIMGDATSMIHKLQ